MNNFFNRFMHPFFYFLYGKAFSDKAKIFVYWVLPRALRPIPFLYRRITRKIYDTYDSLKIVVKFNYGEFECRNLRDFFHIEPNYELEVTKELERIASNLKPNEFFVDVGAHIGRYTVMLGRKYRHRVIAVEPEPHNFNSLRRNVEINDLTDKVILVNMTLGERNGFVDLYLDRLGGGAHSTTKNMGYGKIKVKMKKLDDLIDELKINPKKVRLLKIDVEGAELFVLKGAKKVLRFKPHIIFEAWDEKKLKKVSDYLSRFGYNVKRLDRQNFLAY